MASLIKLYNAAKLALYRRSRLGRLYAGYCTPVEEFIHAHCIGEIPADLLHAHNLARNWGPMPEIGAGYWSPNRVY